MFKSKSFLSCWRKLSDFDKELIGSYAILLVVLSLNMQIVQLKYVGVWLSIALLGTATFKQSQFFFKKSNTILRIFLFMLFAFLLIGYFSILYKAFGLMFDGCHLQGDNLSWSDSFYFSVVTWTTLGYGDFTPYKDVRIFAAVEALFGYLFMGLLIGKVLSLLTTPASRA